MMSNDLPSAGKALLAMLKTRPAALLAISFALIELINLGALPAIKQTIQTNILTAKNTTIGATAVNARIRQQAEADMATQEAAINTQKAAYAARKAKAVALKTAAEAKRDREIARVAGQRQPAEANLATQEAAVLREKAQYEERRARAQAAKTAAEAEREGAAALVKTATVDDTTVINKIKSIITCTADVDLRVTTDRYFLKRQNLELPSVFDADYRQKTWTVYRRLCLR